jgi:predicted transcriptional regulator
MNNLELVKAEDALLTIKEIAEARGVTEHTVRRWAAECDLDPDGYKKNDRGSASPLYSLEKLDAAVSGFHDLKVIAQLSADTKLLLAKGILVKDLSFEELVHIVANQQEQLEHKQEQLLLAYKDTARVEQERDALKFKYEADMYTIMDILEMGGVNKFRLPVGYMTVNGTLDTLTKALFNKRHSHKTKLWTTYALSVLTEQLLADHVIDDGEVFYARVSAKLTYKNQADELED